jgi:DNA polymerase-3 subunit delta'
MVTEPASSAALPLLPWLELPLREALTSQQAHAIWLHGPSGVGQFDLALSLAQAWLCDARALGREPAPACGVCASCRLVLARSHPDLVVLVPEALRESLGWNAGDDEEGGGAPEGSSKRKPSKDIRVEEVRRVVHFAQSTCARGRGKVVVIFPAERMNTVSANALLKTLEEPAGDLRLVLAGSTTDALLPTIRSRCQSLRLALPDEQLTVAWLASQGVKQPEVLLAAAGGQPEEALRWSRDGIDASLWLELPRQLTRGEVGALASWPIARVVDMMFKVCHDAMRVACGSTPLYFVAMPTQLKASPVALARWHEELARLARHAEHPWQAALTIEWLVAQARVALTEPAPSRASLN